MAQWESARLEAEARLVRESKLRNSHNSIHHHLNPPPGFNLPPPSTSSASASTSAHLVTQKPWNTSNGLAAAAADQLESPTSTLTYSENVQIGVNSMPMIEFVGTSSSETGIIKEEGEQEWKFKEGIENSLSFSTSSLHDMTISMEGGWNSTPESLRPNSNNNNGHGNNNVGNVIEEVGFTNLLLNDSIDRSLSDSGKDSDENSGNGGDGSDYYEDNKNYWNSILNLVNSSPSDSPMF
ncbi:hypothetical protein COLO4_10342 [Corchorus olitorius]|uniref:Uncharacterized protein n=1 Tax=Corchorus olitorius TaxID=93759 RepID=A0A1R3K921_9ROSI|nr:hypothetical protein COLO4_10342 [Corchorus olitorius]